MRITKKELIALVLIVLAFISMSLNLHLREPRGDEPLRLTLAYEMFLRGDFIQPTRLGALYFNKPPMFMWLVNISAKFTGWNILAVRVLSVIFTLLTSIFVIIFSWKLFKNKLLSMLSGLIFITFLDVIFYYGFLGEIDATFTFFVALMMFSLYFGFSRNNAGFILLSGFLASIAFLLKGFNAYGFFGLTLIALAIYYREYLKIFSKTFLLSYFVALGIPALWLYFTEDPFRYLQYMLFEVSSRAEGSGNFYKFLTHLITFPLQNFKQTLFTSALVIVVLIMYRVKLLKHPVKLLLLLLLLNYVPYLLFAGGKGMYTVDARYVLPLFPVVAVVFSYILVKPKKDWIIYTLFTLATLTILARLIYSVVIFPKDAKKVTPIEKISADIVSIIDKNEKIACSCKKYKAICFFLERDTGKIVGYPYVYPDWEYLVTCETYKDGKLLRKYRYKGGFIELYER